ncbi:glycolate oxidase [Sulfuricaulis limicola]|uniref:Glycolate oxidase iron-sulfur subunit n=1 Tax=Sulfuricaulis limicola TaxID=1620215 RepID=A0A1B4XIK2_9GAMM|nr:heterodisulfide reductase-related iron-sulfur binding cluster [Sulfuricaulis limicola]BAV34631.1 glycolate oxidase [Sulfuricaulis limicola]
MNPDLHIKREAAKCVACGLCLPHCPTYNLLHDEAESPRGRLSLMLALAKNDLPLSAKLESHLARCLGCRACEKVCPSYVGYGQALDAARALIASRRSANAKPANRSVALIQWLVEKPARMRVLGKLLRLYQATGLQWLLRKSHVLRLVGLSGLDAAVPKLQTQRTFAETCPTKNRPKGRIALFTGCQASLTDQQVLAASIRLLNRLGYETHIPPEQGCCGALHLHDGQTAKAAQLMRRNIAAFANGDDAIVSVASSCAATLCEYGKYPEGDESAGKFSGRIRDINQFLADAVWPENTAFHPLPGRIAVHDPCTMTNVLRQEDKIYALLGKIPGAEIIPLPENRICCGAAGTYHLTQAPIAEQLRTPKIDHLKRLAPDILVTSNPGCASFLAAGMREAGLAIEVMHPVTLLEKQLKT